MLPQIGLATLILKELTIHNIPKPHYHSSISRTKPSTDSPSSHLCVHQPRPLLHKPLGALITGKPLLTLPNFVLASQMLDEGLATGEPLATLVTGVQGVPDQVAFVGQLHIEDGTTVRTNKGADACGGARFLRNKAA